MKFKVIVEYEYPIEHKCPVKAEIVLHGDKVISDNIEWLEQEPCEDCKHYGKLSLDCGRCDDDCSMFEPQESEDEETKVCDIPCDECKHPNSDCYRYDL